MQDDAEGFWYPKADYSSCISCGKCVKVCPTINKIEPGKEPTGYACYNKDEAIRLASSSGGVFSLLSRNILEKGGIVFGVGFDEDFNVVHSFVEAEAELANFRGSKYVQSRIGDSYKQVKKFLKEDKSVLFTGTPCQIAGLKSFLGKDFDNLICVDNVCHGVPSPKVWQKYLEVIQLKMSSKLLAYSFRDKSIGWKEYTAKANFENNKEIVLKRHRDLFSRVFIRDIALRPSCHACAFKGKQRHGDLTLADFWGGDKMHPDMDDNKGLSLVLLNSEKGQKIFEEITRQLAFEKTDVEKALNYNLSALKSTKENPSREPFFFDLDNLDFARLIKKYCSDPPLLAFKKWIKRLLRPLYKKIIR